MLHARMCYAIRRYDKLGRGSSRTRISIPCRTTLREYRKNSRGNKGNRKRRQKVPSQDRSINQYDHLRSSRVVLACLRLTEGRFDDARGELDLGDLLRALLPRAHTLRHFETLQGCRALFFQILLEC